MFRKLSPSSRDSSDDQAASAAVAARQMTASASQAHLKLLHQLEAARQATSNFPVSGRNSSNSANTNTNTYYPFHSHHSSSRAGSTKTPPSGSSTPPSSRLSSGSSSASSSSCSLGDHRRQQTRTKSWRSSHLAAPKPTRRRYSEQRASALGGGLIDYISARSPLISRLSARAAPASDEATLSAASRAAGKRRASEKRSGRSFVSSLRGRRASNAAPASSVRASAGLTSCASEVSMVQSVGQELRRWFRSLQV